MSMLSLVFTFVYHFLLPPFLCILVLVLCLASFGKSLGIRRMYVKWLLKVFKFATQVADEARAYKRKMSSDAGEGHFKVGGDDDEGEEESSEETSQDVQNGVLAEQRMKALMKYGKESRHNVISRRDNLVLMPDGQPPRIEEGNEDLELKASLPDKHDPQKMSASTFQREFHLDSVFDYVKTGIGSIIEDEVTQRFVAEELKMWNLLTRTSQSFEFVTLKLTIIWISGFIVRYCVLLPGRMLILFVGVSFSLFSLSKLEN